MFTKEINRRFDVATNHPATRLAIATGCAVNTAQALDRSVSRKELKEKTVKEEER